VNVQNIPRDDKVVKSAIVPKLDALFFADYPNIELKLLAYYLNNIGHPSMAEFFRQDRDADLHIKTAAGVFGVPFDKVTDSQRQVGKRLNFSIVYGGGIPTLIKQGVASDADEALELLSAFHGAWPGIGWETKRKRAKEGTLAWWIKKRVEERGYITTLWGRHLHPRAAHSALNALCQGCAADLMKWALIEIHEWTKTEGLKSHLINMVHDEIAMDAVKEELPLLAANVPDLMVYEQIGTVVPIRPEPDVSYTSWADKQPYEEAA
jgi:DNA polymerase-1